MDEIDQHTDKYFRNHTAEEYEQAEEQRRLDRFVYVEEYDRPAPWWHPVLLVVILLAACGLWVGLSWLVSLLEKGL